MIKKDTGYLWVFFCIRKNHMPFSISKPLPPVCEMCLNKLSDLESWNSVLRKWGLEKISLNLSKCFLNLTGGCQNRCWTLCRFVFLIEGFSVSQENMLTKVKTTTTWIVRSKLHHLKLKTTLSTILFCPFVLEYNTKSIFEKNSLLHLQQP